MMDRPPYEDPWLNAACALMALALLALVAIGVLEVIG